MDYTSILNKKFADLKDQVLKAMQFASTTLSEIDNLSQEKFQDEIYGLIENIAKDCSDSIRNRRESFAIRKQEYLNTIHDMQLDMDKSMSRLGLTMDQIKAEMDPTFTVHYGNTLEDQISRLGKYGVYLDDLEKQREILLKDKVSKIQELSAQLDETIPEEELSIDDLTIKKEKQLDTLIEDLTEFKTKRMQTVAELANQIRALCDLFQLQSPTEIDTVVLQNQNEIIDLSRHTLDSLKRRATALTRDKEDRENERKSLTKKIKIYCDIFGAQLSDSQVSVETQIDTITAASMYTPEWANEEQKSIEQYSDKITDSALIFLREKVYTYSQIVSSNLTFFILKAKEKIRLLTQEINRNFVFDSSSILNDTNIDQNTFECHFNYIDQLYQEKDTLNPIQHFLRSVYAYKENKDIVARDLSEKTKKIGEGPKGRAWIEAYDKRVKQVNIFENSCKKGLSEVDKWEEENHKQLLVDGVPIREAIENKHSEYARKKKRLINR
ncbi:hypothetical protein WA158_000198 [Blastocystis sp. Blastoise]